MGLDYYKILEVEKTANDDDLKKAYKRLAMKWHPDKNRSDTIVAEANFKLVSEAYDVLNDPNKRAVYDLYGEDGLKAQMPPPPPPAAAAGCQGGASSSQGNNGPSNARKADEVFAEILRSSGQNRGMGGVTSGGGPNRSRFPGSIFDDDLFAGLRGGAGGSGSSTGGGGGGGGGDGTVNQSAQRKASPVEKNLPCSLEELYNGATKKMKISREVVDTTGKSSTVEEILNIDIKPGWRKGTKITFPDKGNELPNIRPADLVFIIDERRHSKFTRDKNDLVVTYQISLVEALAGCTIQVKTLDGRVLTIPITQVVHPSYEEIVPNEGMPVAKEPNKKGNLRIKFNIKFPERLTQIQKNMVRDVFK